VYYISMTITRIFEFLGLARKGRTEAIRTIAQECYGLRDGAREGIFTPMHLFVARKPKK
jgi:sterol 24-C-methyltransferase